MFLQSSAETFEHEIDRLLNLLNRGKIIGMWMLQEL